MELLKLGELLAEGFYSAFSKFKAEMENRDMALQEKLQQVLQTQQASQEVINSINEAVTSESTQITEAIATLTQTNSQQQETITQQGQQIKDLLAQLEQGNTTLAEAETVIDQIIQQQQTQLTQQQETVSKIESIFS